MEERERGEEKEKGRKRKGSGGGEKDALVQMSSVVLFCGSPGCTEVPVPMRLHIALLLCNARGYI